MDTNIDDGLDCDLLGEATLRKLATMPNGGRLPVNVPSADDEYIPTTPLVTPVKGEYERLMDTITLSVRSQEDDCPEPYLDRIGCLTIVTRLPKRPELSNNGGDYEYWHRFIPTGFGVKSQEFWSCDIQELDPEGETFGCLVSTEGLLRMSQLAILTIAAERWLKKEQGTL